MEPGTPEHAAEIEALCLKLTQAAGLAVRAIERQERQIAALAFGVAHLSREMEERCGTDRAALARGALAEARQALGEDAERDELLRRLFEQGEPTAAEAPPGPALRLIPGGKP